MDYMILGVGVDIESVDRFKRVSKRPAKIIDQVYSFSEQEICSKEEFSYIQYCAAFSIKEATFKALGKAWLESDIFWKDIELLSPYHSGYAEVRLSGSARELFFELGAVQIYAVTEYRAILTKPTVKSARNEQHKYQLKENELTEHESKIVISKVVLSSVINTDASVFFSDSIFL